VQQRLHPKPTKIETIMTHSTTKKIAALNDLRQTFVGHGYALQAAGIARSARRPS
jgi:hypothetical protein